MDLLRATNTVSIGAADASPTSGTGGWATDGNPATSTPGTIFPAHAYNDLLGEIYNAIFGLGITPDPSSRSQLLAAIQGYALKKALNLSDLASVPTALSNLGFTNSISSAFWQKIGGGLILQGGTITVNSTSANYSFPLTFPTSVLSLHVSENGSSNVINAGFFSNDSLFSAASNSGTPLQASWLAIGH